MPTSEPMPGTVFLCATCGTAYPPSRDVPERCIICQDPRQYVPPTGQTWVSEVEVASRFTNGISRLEPGLYALRTEPAFAIGQRALLVRTDEGNVLWDCLSVLDPATVAAVESLGGLAAIAISHPHYYSSHRRWAQTFDVPVFLHADDAAWVVDPHPRVEAWTGDERALPGGMTLVRAGGHFPGGAVLRWPGADGRGVLLSGDIVQVVPDRSVAAFMYSFPNHVPLPAWEVEAVARCVLEVPFERVYGAFVGREILSDGAASVRRGRDQVLAALRGELPGMRPRPRGSS